MTTLDKVRRLERYIAVGSPNADPVKDIAIEKLLAREINRLVELRKSLEDQLKEFESKYAIDSPEFYARYESGNAGSCSRAIGFAESRILFMNSVITQYLSTRNRSGPVSPNQTNDPLSIRSTHSSSDDKQTGKAD